MESMKIRGQGVITDINDAGNNEKGDNLSPVSFSPVNILPTVS
jgi:hypothetical protein